MIDAITLLKKLQTVNPDAIMRVAVRTGDELTVNWEWIINREVYSLGLLIDRRMMSDPSWLDCTIEKYRQEAIRANQSVQSDPFW